jgi:hypothetical protein
VQLLSSARLSASWAIPATKEENLEIYERTPMLSLLKTSAAVLCLVFVLFLAAPYAQADDVTFAVSGTLTPNGGSAACGSSGCTVGGDVVIDTTAGTMTSGDITVTGASPVLGPFTINEGGGPKDGIVVLWDFEDASGDGFDFAIQLGTLVGYDGGSVSNSVYATASTHWLFSGSLTPPTQNAAEPNSVLLVLAGVGGLFAVSRRRISRASRLVA